MDISLKFQNLIEFSEFEGIENETDAKNGLLFLDKNSICVHLLTINTD